MDWKVAKKINDIDVEECKIAIGIRNERLVDCRSLHLKKSTYLSLGSLSYLCCIWEMG
jgi:hypothetical protein